MIVAEKLLLAFPVSEPVEVHVHRLSLFGLYFTIYDGTSHGIVGLERGDRLLVP